VRLPAAPSPRVSVVVVTATRPERLVRCLEAVARHAPPTLPLEVLLVLNGATPDVVATVERDVEAARVVTSDLSLGFAGGLNLGARHAAGELLHVLHDDTEVTEGWLSPLVDALDRDQGVGVAGSVLLNPDGSVQSAGWVLRPDGTTEAPWQVAPTVDSLGGEPFPVDYCPSASLVVRRVVWEMVDGADEEFHPAYYVDVDLAMSVRRQGSTVVCVPSSRVKHAKASPPRFREFAAERNRRRFVAKWVDAARNGAQLAPGDARERALLRDLRFKEGYIEHLENAVDTLARDIAVIEAGRVRRAHRRAMSAVGAVRRVAGLLRRR
jgi:GT2 family glycosyltransferase